MNHTMSFRLRPIPFAKAGIIIRKYIAWYTKHFMQVVAFARNRVDDFAECRLLFLNLSHNLNIYKHTSMS